MCLNAEQSRMEGSDLRQTKDDSGGREKSCHLDQVPFPNLPRGGEGTKTTPKIRSSLLMLLLPSLLPRTQCTASKENPSNYKLRLFTINSFLTPTKLTTIRNQICWYTWQHLASLSRNIFLPKSFQEIPFYYFLDSRLSQSFVLPYTSSS